jgi:hypothetical protein
MRETPWALIFDDGLDGVTVIDPNHPTGTNGIPIEGQRPGDQPFRLELVGGHLVVGWDRVYAVDLDTAASTLLGDATIFLPAAEPDRVWLIDYPGGRLGAGIPRAWQVSVLGEVISPPFELKTDGVPEIGVASGLALESDSGILIWDLDEEEVVARLGLGSSFISDTTSEQGAALAWCDDPCDELHITDIPFMEDQTIIHPGQGNRFLARAARFSSDGRYLAAPTEAGDIIVFDRGTGRSHVAFSLPPNHIDHLEWAPSTNEIFATALVENELTTRIALHMLGTGRPETMDVCQSLGSDFVVVREEDARSLLGQSTD